MSDFECSYEKVDIGSWHRRSEYEFFSKNGSCFTAGCEADITNLRRYGKERGFKLYPLLIAVSMTVLNSHAEFRYGRQGEELVIYDTVHPLFFDPTPDGDVRCLCARYRSDVGDQVAEIEKVRDQYAGSRDYRPQGKLPDNSVNISIMPWQGITGISLTLQYDQWYYAPMIIFGRFEQRGDRTVIPFALRMNHAVNDGGHAAVFTAGFSGLAEMLCGDPAQWHLTILHAVSGWVKVGIATYNTAVSLGRDGSFAENCVRCQDFRGNGDFPRKSASEECAEAKGLLQHLYMLLEMRKNSRSRFVVLIILNKNGAFLYYGKAPVCMKQTGAYCFTDTPEKPRRILCSGRIIFRKRREAFP